VKVVGRPAFLPIDAHGIYSPPENAPYSNPNPKANGAHELRPGLGLSLAVINTSNSPRARYRGSKDRMDRTTLNFVTMNASLNGQV